MNESTGGKLISGNNTEPELKGWLLKWTNYLKGYQRRWFVLSNGVLSYYRLQSLPISKQPIPSTYEFDYDGLNLPILHERKEAEQGANGGYSGGRVAGGKLSIRRRRKGPRQENQAEMSQTCRGTISLHGALIHTVDSCTFVITNGGTQTFHIKAANEVIRQSWVTTLELAKAKAIRDMESDEDEDDSNALATPSEELNAVIKDLTSKLENLRTCYDLISKHGRTLQSALIDLETNDDLQSRNKIVSERATLFRISSNAMINACDDYLKAAQNQGHKWSKMLQHERDQRQHLEETIEQLARQHSHLEQAAHRHRPNPATSTSDDEDNEFYDAQEEGASIASQEDSSFILKIPVTMRRNSNDATGSSSEGEEPKSETQQVLVVAQNNNQQYLSHNQQKQSQKHQQHQQQQQSSSSSSPSLSRYAENTVTSVSASASASASTLAATGGGCSTGNSGTVSKKRRTRVAEKPNYPLNLWSIMKNCIGKDLSKIPMPVNFNEPLSMLQRLTEDYEYTDLLDKAAMCKDPCEQLAYVAAFTISSYSTTSNRTGKPFNPLLGETYECDRTDDLGWKCLAEQVSHHPPMAAIHCEGKGWSCWQEFTMTTKFRGKYLQVIPLGNAYVEFKQTGNRYGWRKVTTTVHNIIVGKLWVDHHGDMDIIGRNNAKGIKCHLKYIPYSYFTRETQRRVKGAIVDRDGQVKWVISGTWDNKIEIAPVISTSGSVESPVYKTGNYKTIWIRQIPPRDSDKYYNFTELACQLNELESNVAPTDSRLRPDQRLMEEGQWEESNGEKMRLEEKQRSARRQREADAERAAAEGRPYPPYEPIWFVKTKDEDDTEGFDNLIHVYRGNYWEAKRKQEWSHCPDIF